MRAIVSIRRVSLFGFLFSQFALVALAADNSPDAKKPAAEGQPAKYVRGYLRVHAIQPSLSAGAEKKLDLAEFDFYKRNLAALIKSPLVIDFALNDKTIRDLPLIRQHEAGLSDWLAEQIS